jgi:hypothetical protein
MKYTVIAKLIKTFEIEVEAEDANQAIESLDDWISDDFEAFETNAQWDFEAI